MRTRLVVWGNNAKDEKVLLAISLNADDNKVDIWSIPEKEITEEFYNLMMSQWREGQDMQYPPGTEHRITELTMAESILPDDLKVEKTDVIQRAQMEWHFVILSTKLYKNFKNELEDLSDKIKRLEIYDQALWDELKEMWTNVQQHIFDKNLFRDHADSLREKSNALFDGLKKLRKNLSVEINQKSKETSDIILNKLEEVNQKIQSGALLKPLFDQLIVIQKEMNGLSLIKANRDILLSKLNDAFKIIREKREHRESNRDQNTSGTDHIFRRYEGLVVAIKKMEQSIDFEKRNIEFENRRIATTTGQLEAQIRVAKIKMIEERIRSKEEKLKELLQTREKLESLTEKIKKREEKFKSRQDRHEKVAIEKEKIKAKINEEIHLVHDQIPENVQEKLTKAAEEIKSSKKSSRKKATPEKTSDIDQVISETNPDESATEVNNANNIGDDASGPDQNNTDISAADQEEQNPSTESTVNNLETIQDEAISQENTINSEPDYSAPLDDEDESMDSHKEEE